MKSPSFQFYPTDYLGSQRVQMMSLEEEGAYIRLISSCWQHGSIPADAEKCARLIGKGASTTLATVVQAMFKQDANDATKLVHERLELERQKQILWREKSAAGGRKSAGMRAGKPKKNGGSPSKSKGGSRVVEPPLQPNGNSSVFCFLSSVSGFQSPDSTSTFQSPNDSEPPATPSLDFESAKIEIGSWFHRRSSTTWSEKELRAFAGIKKPVDADDWQALKWFYTKSGCNYLRRDLLTLLNNWSGEIDRAKNYDPSAK